MPPPAPKKGEKVTIPRRTSQHQRLFENIYTHATPTDLGHQRDVRNTNPTDVAQLTDLGLGMVPRDPFTLNRTQQGIANNMYPDMTGPSCIPDTLVKATEKAGATPLTRPPTKTVRAKVSEIYDRYIEETNQDTAPEALIPMAYQLRLEKIARSCKNLEAEVLEMGE